MPKKIDHAERKDQIVEAMFRIIHDHGFEKATLREIAREAALSLGSVQHFFPKQKDIYTFAMDVIYQRFEERMEKVVKVNQGAFENAVRMINQIVHANTEEERMENDIWMKFSIMATMNPEYQETKDRFREVNVQFAEKIIGILQQNGYMSPVNFKNSVNSLVIFIHGLVFESVIYANSYNAVNVEDEIRRYVRRICGYSE